MSRAPAGSGCRARRVVWFVRRSRAARFWVRRTAPRPSRTSVTPAWSRRGRRPRATSAPG